MKNLGAIVAAIAIAIGGYFAAITGLVVGLIMFVLLYRRIGGGVGLALGVAGLILFSLGGYALQQLARHGNRQGGDEDDPFRGPTK